MRTRDEIETEAQKGRNMMTAEQEQALLLRLILEVALDMRDSLSGVESNGARAIAEARSGAG